MHDLSAATQMQMAVRPGVSRALVSRARSVRSGEIGASWKPVEIDGIPASAQALPPLTTHRQTISERVAAFGAVAARQHPTASIPGKLLIRKSCATVLTHKNIQ